MNPILIKSVELFHTHTKYKQTKHGHEVSCVKGLFSVTAPTRVQAEKEAFYYFMQYYNDGEYNEKEKK